MPFRVVWVLTPLELRVWTLRRILVESTNLLGQRVCEVR